MARENRARAARRAKGRVRRFCVANRCAYLWTLTFAEKPESVEGVARAVEAFVRRLRPGRPIPYVWVIERGTKNDRLHVHLALNRYVHWTQMTRRWGHGFVFVTGEKSDRGHGKHMGSKGVARYVAKYVTKELAGGAPGRQTYRVAQGFQPREVTAHAWSLDDAWHRAVEAFDGEVPAYTWRSTDQQDDEDRAPPCWWSTWEYGT